MLYKDYNIAIKNGYWNQKMKYSTDITIEWLGEKSKRDNKILKYKLYDEFKYKGKVYKIDGQK